MSVAENIKRYLEEKGMMQNAVAQKAGMRADSFSSALNGKRKISIDEYINICTALEEPVGRFISPQDSTEKEG